MKDYRAESYKKKAKERFENSPTKNQSVSINPSSVVKSDIKGVSQVAVKGGGGSNIVYTNNVSGVQTTQEQQDKIVSDTPVVKPFVDYAKKETSSTTSVGISPSLASKINSQSLRGDRSYYVDVDKKVRTQSVNQSVKDDLRQSAIKKSESDAKKKEIYESTPFFPLVEGVKFATKKPLDFTYSDIPSEQERLRKQEVGKEGFASILVMGGTFTGTKGGIPSRAKLDVKSNSKVVQFAKDDVVNSVIRFDKGGTVVTADRGYILPRFNAKTGFYKTEKFNVLGVVGEKATRTGKVGSVSGESIFGTKGGGNLLVQSQNTGKTSFIKISSKGGEVGGFGNKITTIEATKTPSRVGNVDSFVERYQGKTVGDNSVVGVVSKKGQSISVINPESVIVKRGVTRSTFSVKSASEGVLGVEARKTGSNILDRLVREQPVRSLPGGSGESVVGDSVLLSKKGGSVISIFPDTIAKQSVATSLASKKGFVVNPVSSVLSSKGKTTESKSTVNVQSGFDANPFIKTISYKSFIPQQTETRTTPRTSPVLGQTSFSSIGQVSRSQNAIKNDNVLSSKQGLGTEQVVSSKQSLGTEQILSQKQVLRTDTVLQSKSAITSRGVTSSVPVTTTVPVGFGFLPKKGFGGKFGVEVRRGGKFFSVGKNLSFSKAYNKGSFVVGNSAAATFRLTQRGKPISVNSQSSSFYSKGTNVIEKRSRRIKSRGELQEITFKGIATQRKRSSVF